MRIGELFAGIGGASLAVHAAVGGASTVWQSDLIGEAVRARHFPGAVQLIGDVRELDPRRLPAVDILTAGFPCQDLSVAGPGLGLDGPRSGLYREVLRFTSALRPARVLIENVPALIKLIPRLSADFRALGYGLTWTVCEAADAGLPHLRRRVFVLAEADTRGRGLVDVDRSRRWEPANERTWPSPRADEARTSGARTGRGGSGESLTYAARLWATPAASNPNDGEDPARWQARRARAAAKHGNNGIGEPLGQQVRTWPTPVSRDYKSGDTPNRKGTEARSAAAGAPAMALYGRRLSAAWVEALMGYPAGWTEPTGPALSFTFPPPVRGRYPEGWDRSQPWPGFAWEPPRTLPDGPPVPGRKARIAGLGNSWCPPQAALAIRALLTLEPQLCLL